MASRGKHLSHAEIQHIFLRGLQTKNKPLTAWYIEGLSQKSRCVVRVLASAVRLSTRRNRIKRLLKEAFRILFREREKSIDMIITVSSDPKFHSLPDATRALFFLTKTLRTNNHNLTKKSPL